MDNLPEASSSTKSSAPSSVGAVLRAARESQGLTVADVAERIKFSVKQLEALEEGKHDGLPEGAFLRGFVRSYARTLHLDEAPLLELMTPVQAQHGDDSAAPKGRLEFIPTRASNKKNLYLIATSLFVLIALGLFVWSQKYKVIVDKKVVVQELKLPDMESASAVVTAASAVSAASAVAEVEVESVQVLPAPKVVEPAQVPVVAIKVTAPVASAVVAKPKMIEPPSAVVTPNTSIEKPTVPLEQLKKRPIHIVFTQDSWMEIKDANGELLLSRMNAAGTEKWIGGNRRAPYQVAIGKVEAVKVFYRGSQVDLSKYNQTGVVRFLLE